jgi:hypothetical protein
MVCYLELLGYEPGSSEMSENRRLIDLEGKIRALGKDVTSLVSAVSALRATLTKIIPEEALPKEVRQSWLKRNGQVLTLSIAALACLFTGLKWFQPEWSAHLAGDLHSTINADIDQKLGEPRKILDGHTKQLERIQTALEGLTKNVELLLRKELKIMAELPEKQFEQNLDLVANDLSTASQHDIAIEASIVAKIQSALKTAKENSPDYWRAVSALVTQQYISRNQVTLASTLSAPACVPAGGGLVFREREISCPSGSVLDLDNKTITNSVVENLVIRYRGSPATIKNTIFIDCTFILDLSSSLSPVGKTIAKQIFLASPTDKVRIDAT